MKGDSNVIRRIFAIDMISCWELEVASYKGNTQISLLSIYFFILSRCKGVLPAIPEPILLELELAIEN